MSWMSEFLDDCEDRIGKFEEAKTELGIATSALRVMISQKNEVWLDGGVPFFYQRDKDVIQDVIEILEKVQSI